MGFRSNQRKQSSRRHEIEPGCPYTSRIVSKSRLDSDSSSGDVDALGGPVAIDSNAGFSEPSATTAAAAADVTASSVERVNITLSASAPADTASVCTARTMSATALAAGPEETKRSCINSMQIWFTLECVSRREHSHVQFCSYRAHSHAQPCEELLATPVVARGSSGEQLPIPRSAVSAAFCMWM